MAGLLSKGPNRTKQKLFAGKAVSVLNPDHPDPSLVEHLGHFGIDAVLLDVELQSADVQTLENLRRAADVAGLTAIVRPATDAPWLITRYINRGVGGIHVPHVATAAQAAQVVESVQHTLTHNGVVAGRAENFLTVVSIDSMEALNNVVDIARIAGVDVVYVDPIHLSNSMGGRARIEGSRNPDVITAVYRALEQIVGAGKIAGTAAELDDVRTLRKKGVQYIYERLNRVMEPEVRTFVNDATG